MRFKKKNLAWGKFSVKPSLILGSKFYFYARELTFLSFVHSFLFIGYILTKIAKVLEALDSQSYYLNVQTTLCTGDSRVVTQEENAREFISGINTALTQLSGLQ